jgi:hypothetical protein
VKVTSGQVQMHMTLSALIYHMENITSNCSSSDITMIQGSVAVGCGIDLERDKGLFQRVETGRVDAERSNNCGPEACQIACTCLHHAGTPKGNLLSGTEVVCTRKTVPGVGSIGTTEYTNI